MKLELFVMGRLDSAAQQGLRLVTTDKIVDKIVGSVGSFIKKLLFCSSETALSSYAASACSRSVGFSRHMLD